MGIVRGEFLQQGRDTTFLLMEWKQAEEHFSPATRLNQKPLLTRLQCNNGHWKALGIWKLHLSLNCGNVFDKQTPLTMLGKWALELPNFHSLIQSNLEVPSSLSRHSTEGHKLRLAVLQSCSLPGPDAGRQGGTFPDGYSVLEDNPQDYRAL